MKKLIPKYQNGLPIRVFIQNTDPNKESEEAYVYVDKDGRPVLFNPNTGEFAAHRGSPNGKVFWTTKADTTTDYRSPVPTYDLSIPFENPKNRELIATNRRIAQNNNYYNLFTSTPNEILRDWLLQNSQGSAKRLWYDNNGTPHWEFGEQGMSAADPVGRFYVEGVGIGKALEGSALLGRYIRGLRSSNPSYKATIADPSSISINPVDDIDIKSRMQKIYSTIPDRLKTNAPEGININGYTVLGKVIDKGGHNNRYLSEIERRLLNLGEKLTNKTGEYGPTFVYADGYSGGLVFKRSLHDALKDATSKPIIIGYNTGLPNVSGEYYRNSKLPFVNLFSSDGKTIPYTILHEGIMHPTDPLIESLGYHKLYKEWLDKLVDFPDEEVTSIPDGYIINGIEIKQSDIDDAILWLELRATLGEYNRMGHMNMSKMRDTKDLDVIVPEYESNLDNTLDDNLLIRLARTNWYGQTYKNLLKAHIPERRVRLIKDLKELMKTAPAIGGEVLISNDKKGGKLIPKHQSGGLPNTFVGAATKALGGNYETADKISAASSIYPPVGLVLGALDLGYDLNGLYHGDKTGKDVVLDVFSMMPGLRLARKINLLKKSKDPIMYYYKELSKYLKKYANKINDAINFGKFLDVVDDATH